ncbi:EF-hand calcium-binding domain-containing protein 4B, partial [Eurypyga helias]
FQRLHPELPLGLEELHKVFVTLDADGNGSLTPKEFTTRFSEFRKHVSCIELHSYSILSTSSETACPFKCEESMSDDEDEEFQFSNLIHLLGAKKVSNNQSDVKQPCLQLRKDNPHLLSSFEEFLFRIFSELQEVGNEKNSLECVLERKIAAYDEEIKHLCEEMEQQIKKEKKQFLLK